MRYELFQAEGVAEVELGAIIIIIRQHCKYLIISKSNNTQHQMSNKQMQQELKAMMETFLAGIKIEQNYLTQSQIELNNILDQCVLKTESINQSAFVTQEKCDIINQKLSRIPKLQARIQVLSKLFYEAHKRIQIINKNLGHLDKIQQIQAQYEGRVIQKKQDQKMFQYEVGLTQKKSPQQKQQQKQQQNINQRQKQITQRKQ